MRLSSTCDQKLLLDSDFREFRVWDGDIVVYDGQSGDTHRLLRPAGLIIETLSRTGRLSPTTLYETCTAAQALDHSDFEQTLALLIDLGILAPS